MKKCIKSQGKVREFEGGKEESLGVLPLLRFNLMFSGSDKMQY